MSVFSKKRLEELQAQERLHAFTHTVMIVDDEESNRAVMATILRPYYRLIEARDGAHALELIAQMAPQDTPACIVSDQRMPNLTGVELFQKVQTLLPQTVRIIVTGYVDVDSIVDSINKAEIYKFIVKPFDVHDFLLTVRRGVECFDLRCQLNDYHKDLANQVRQRTQELEQSRASLLHSNQELQAEIAERQRAEAALQRSNEQILALYNNASCGYHALDHAGVFTHINETELRWLKRERDEVVGRLKLADIVSAPSWKRFMERYAHLERDGWNYDLRDVELELVAADGALVPVLCNAVALNDGGTQVCRFTVFDITERNEEQARIRHLASHDVLTGLPNRALMRDRIERDLLNARRSGCMVAVLFIDLDKFKPINDALGHQVGDHLLQQVACRLRDCVRKSDSVARFGGDEFVISLADLCERDDVLVIARKVIDALASIFIIDGNELHIGASVGISVFPGDGETVDALMRHADLAMYGVKSRGRNGFAFHCQD